jgi:predicted MPP superfamily phosphohydrolase
MNLRKSCDIGRIFDALIITIVLVASVIAYFSFLVGGWKNIFGILSVCGIALIVYGVFFETRRLKVTRYREKLVHHPGAWIRLVFLSDFHAGAFRPKSWYERIATEAQALDPDVLFLVGDFVDSTVDGLQDLKTLADVRAHLGRYFILGNHDYLDRPHEVRKELKRWGIADLTNSQVTLKKEGHVLQLSALDDHLYGVSSIPPLRASKELPHVTIVHGPDAIVDFSHGDTDLMVAGHTHGGQIRLPFVGPLAPLPSKLGRIADKGRKVLNGIPLIISQGLGESDVRARLFCPAEIVVVEFGI